MAEKLKETI